MEILGGVLYYPLSDKDVLEAYGVVLLLVTVALYHALLLALLCLGKGQIMTSVVFHSVSGEHRAEDQHKQQKQAEPEDQQEDQQEARVTSPGSQTMVGTPSVDYVAPYTPHDMGHAMGQFAYPNPNIDPYYGSIYAAYGGQPMGSDVDPVVSSFCRSGPNKSLADELSNAIVCSEPACNASRGNSLDRCSEEHPAASCSGHQLHPTGQFAAVQENHCAINGNGVMYLQSGLGHSAGPGPSPDIWGSCSKFKWWPFNQWLGKLLRTFYSSNILVNM